MRVFVSSTFQDLEPYREAVLRGLRQIGHDVVAMEDFTAASAPPLQRVLERVTEADAYVGVFAWRYGYIPLSVPPGVPLPVGFEGGRTSITHAEYIRRFDTPVKVFVATP